MNNLPVAGESITYILCTSFITVVLYYASKPLSIIGLLLLAFVIFFFRNPYRRAPDGDNIIVSPADGTVITVTEIYESDFLKSKAVKVSIFLSLFNVHINRTPISGVVRFTSYRPGKYLPAFKSHASDINERNTVAIEGGGVKVLVHQITGFIARRIVCRVREGDRLQKGERFGMIKFGSCTEIVMPADISVMVKPGDKVRGGKTIIGVIN